MTDRQYTWTDEMREISGFGGAYEDACREMVVAGLRWFDRHPDAKKVTDPGRSDVAAHMADSVDGSPTGAMVNHCLAHVMYAHQHGWEAYQEAMSHD